MHLRYMARSAAKSQSMREQIKREGRTRYGHFPLWTEEEDDHVRRLYPDYKALAKVLKRRSHSSIICRAVRLKVTKSRQHRWTDGEVSRLRKLYSTTTAKQLRAAFPHLKNRQIKDKASAMGLYKKRRPYPPSGFPVIDQIMQRAFELNITMTDLDAMANTKTFFRHRAWRKRHSPNVWAVCLAIETLDGDVKAVWRDN